MASLVIGGTSGLGLEIAKQLHQEDEMVVVTGRTDPGVEGLDFRPFDLTAPELPKRMGELVMGLPELETLVYAAGYYQEGRVTDLSEEQIEDMIDVGGRGLIYAVRAVLLNQEHLDELVTITSTSQWTPRKAEPVYNFVKAGAGHISHAFAEDERIDSVLVAGPAGMNTKFWQGVERGDIDSMMDPAWVAEQIVSALDDDFRYKFMKILRDPPRVEIADKR